VPPLAKWAPDGRGNRKAGSPQFVYNLYLLTISPIVVLAVPKVQGDRREQCNGGRDGCIVSRALDVDFYYRSLPPIRTGSFLFSPDLKIPYRELPASEARISLSVGASVLELNAEAGKWRISRDLLK